MLRYLIFVLLVTTVQSCSTDDDCSSTQYCDTNSICTQKKIHGASCDDDSQCTVIIATFQIVLVIIIVVLVVIIAVGVCQQVLAMEGAILHPVLLDCIVGKTMNVIHN